MGAMLSPFDFAIATSAMFSRRLVLSAEGGWSVTEPNLQTAGWQGCDATHRASNSDTHLTHGCMPVFRRFWRLRRECAALANGRHGAIPGFFGGATRTPKEAAR